MDVFIRALCLVARACTSVENYIINFFLLEATWKLSPAHLATDVSA